MLTFVTPTLLAGDRSLTSVVIHEITHSWTGNLVATRPPHNHDNSQLPHLASFLMLCRVLQPRPYYGKHVSYSHGIVSNCTPALLR